MAIARTTRDHSDRHGAGNFRNLRRREDVKHSQRHGSVGDCRRFKHINVVWRIVVDLRHVGRVDHVQRRYRVRLVNQTSGGRKDDFRIMPDGWNARIAKRKL